MAKTTKKVTIYTCDGCGKQVPELDEFTEVYGYWGGKVSHVDASHGNSVKEWFACDTECVQAAIVNALRRAWCGCNTGCEQCD